MLPNECEKALKDVELYLDGETEGDVRAEIDEHLTRCGPCMDRAEFRRKLQELIARKCCGEEAPPGLRERVLAALERE